MTKGSMHTGSNGICKLREFSARPSGMHTRSPVQILLAPTVLANLFPLQK